MISGIEVEDRSEKPHRVLVTQLRPKAEEHWAA